jgi:DNA-binding NarL/FixJ family response regulator
MVSLQPFVNGVQESRQEQEHILIADLVRRLVRVVIADQHAVQSQQERHEIILDIDVDGARYILLRTPSSSPVLDSLSPREQQIVRMVAKGCSNKAIAAALQISSWTVCTHLRRTFAKLGVTSRAAMVARLLEEHNGWGQPPNGRGMPIRQHAKSSQP